MDNPAIWEHGTPRHVSYGDLCQFLHDQTLSKAGYAIDRYFDTADVQRALLGMHDYLGRKAQPLGARAVVNVADFNKPSALVSALLASGHLGRFRLLPPHQSELVRKLSSFATPDDWDPRREELLRESFLDAIGLPTHSRRRPKLSEMSAAKLETYVNKYVGNAETFFKSLQCVAYTWWERLEYWNRKKLLSADTIKIDYDALYRDRSFNDVFHSFERLRPRHDDPRSKTHLNSMADAFVLLAVANVAETSPATRRVVRFCDSTGLFQRVADDAGIAARLLAPMPPGSRSQSTNLLVGSGYCIAQATITPADVRTSHRVFTEQDILALDLEVQSAAGGSSWRGPDSLDDLLESADVGVRPITRRLLSFSFFEKLWLPTAAIDEVRQLRSRLEASASVLRSAEFLDKFSELVRSTRSTFERNAVEFRSIGEIWRDLEAGLPAFARKLGSLNYAREVSLPRDLDLTRFNLPEEAISFVSDFADALRNAGEQHFDVLTSAQWREFVMACFRAKTSTSDALKSVALLWAMTSLPAIRNHYRWILTAERSLPLSLEVVFLAACIIRSDANWLSAARSHLRRLVDKHELTLQQKGRRTQRPCGVRMSRSDELAAATAFAYLHFHIWKAEGNRAYWRGKGIDLDSSGPARPGDLNLERAIAYTDAAWQIIALADAALDNVKYRAKRAYAVNQRLYYRTEQGKVSEMHNMDEMRRELVQYEGDPVTWDFTYHDTMARYYEFVSLFAEEPTHQRDLLSRAIARAKAATAGAGEDLQSEKVQIVNEYLDHLLFERARRHPV